MASITSLGSGSNLDLESLLTKMVDAEKQAPQTLITNRKSLATATISALGSVQSKLSALQTAMAKLKDTSFFAGKTATSSNKDAFTVTAGNSADAGSYDVSVIQLAKASKIASGNFSDATTTVGTGTLSISGGGTAFTVKVTAGQNDTLAGIRDSINSAPGNTGVKASIMTVSDNNGGSVSKLVMTATSTGASSQIAVTVADDDGNNTDTTGLSQLYYEKGGSASLFTEVNSAQDAKITVDGFTATSSTNVFSNTITGVTITAVKGATDPNDLTTAPTGTAAVIVDQDSIKTAVTAFVTAYNDYAKTLSALVTPSKDANAASSSGALSGDSSLLSIRSQLKQIIASPVEGAPSDLSSLAFLGISTNVDGTLTLNSDKLTTALNTRPDDVKTLFTGTNGVATKFDALISNMTGAGGLFQSRTDSLNNQLRALDDQQTKLDARIESFTKRYRAQFTALDSLVSQLNSTGSFLTQQLDAAAKIITRKSE